MNCFSLWCNILNSENLKLNHVDNDKSILCKSLEELTDIDILFAWFFTLPFLNNDLFDFLMKEGD